MSINSADNTSKKKAFKLKPGEGKRIMALALVGVLLLSFIASIVIYMV